MSLPRFIVHLRWDDIFLSICSMVAIGIGVIDFIPILQLTNDPILRIILSLIGLLLGAIVVQKVRTRTEFKELKIDLIENIGLKEVELLNTYNEFGKNIAAEVLKAERSVWDTQLCHVQQKSNFTSYFSGNLPEYRRLLYQRLSRKELVSCRVEVIINRVNLEEIIQALLIHERFNYFIRYYNAPPDSIPIMNLMSFDGDVFYFGGFHTGGWSGASPPVLYVRDPNLTIFYKSYWNELWNNAKPLNESKAINWSELLQIGLNLGLNDNEFDEMVSYVKNDVQQEKRQINLG